MKSKTLNKSQSSSLNSQSVVRKRTESIYNLENKVKNLKEEKASQFKYQNPSSQSYFQTSVSKWPKEQPELAKKLDQLFPPQIKPDNYLQTEIKKFQNFNFVPNELTRILKQSQISKQQSQQETKELQELIQKFSPKEFLQGKYQQPQDEVLWKKDDWNYLLQKTPLEYLLQLIWMNDEHSPNLSQQQILGREIYSDDFSSSGITNAASNYYQQFLPKKSFLSSVMANQGKSFLKQKSYNQSNSSKSFLKKKNINNYDENYYYQENQESEEEDQEQQQQLQQDQQQQPEEQEQQQYNPFLAQLKELQDSWQNIEDNQQSDNKELFKKVNKINQPIQQQQQSQEQQIEIQANVNNFKFSIEDLYAETEQQKVYQFKKAKKESPRYQDEYNDYQIQDNSDYVDSIHQKYQRMLEQSQQQHGSNSDTFARINRLLETENFNDNELEKNLDQLSQEEKNIIYSLQQQYQQQYKFKQSYLQSSTQNQEENTNNNNNNIQKDSFIQNKLQASHNTNKNAPTNGNLDEQYMLFQVQNVPDQQLNTEQENDNYQESLINQNKLQENQNYQQFQINNDYQQENQNYQQFQINKDDKQENQNYQKFQINKDDKQENQNYQQFQINKDDKQANQNYQKFQINKDDKQENQNYQQFQINKDDKQANQNYQQFQSNQDDKQENQNYQINEQNNNKIQFPLVQDEQERQTSKIEEETSNNNSTNNQTRMLELIQNFASQPITQAKITDLIKATEEENPKEAQVLIKTFESNRLEKLEIMSKEEREFFVNDIMKNIFKTMHDGNYKVSQNYKINSSREFTRSKAKQQQQSQQQQQQQKNQNKFLENFKNICQILENINDQQTYTNESQVVEVSPEIIINSPKKNESKFKNKLTELLVQLTELNSPPNSAK